MIQLDTNALIWRELDPDKLSLRAKLAIEEAAKAGEEISVSPITLWEIAQLTARGRIQLNISIKLFLKEIEDNYRVTGITSSVVVEAAHLADPFPKDPTDRLIAASAIVEGLTLITADRNILASRACKLLW